MLWLGCLLGNLELCLFRLLRRWLLVDVDRQSSREKNIPIFYFNHCSSSSVDRALTSQASCEQAIWLSTNTHGNYINLLSA